MNLYVLLGAACSDADFANLLFSDPDEAVACLNLTLSSCEQEQLDALVAANLTEGFVDDFAKLRAKICPPHGVCPWVSNQNPGRGGTHAADD